MRFAPKFGSNNTVEKRHYFFLYCFIWWYQRKVWYCKENLTCSLSALVAEEWTAWSTILHFEHLDTEDASSCWIASAVHWCIQNSLRQSRCLLRVPLSKETFRLRNTEVHHFLEDSSTQIMLPRIFLMIPKKKQLFCLSHHLHWPALCCSCLNSL